MKLIEPQQTKKEFEPFDITIRIESLDDAQKLYFIFNYVPLVKSFGFMDISGTIRDFLRKKDFNIESSIIFTNLSIIFESGWNLNCERLQRKGENLWSRGGDNSDTAEKGE